MQKYQNAQLLYLENWNFKLDLKLYLIPALVTVLCQHCIFFYNLCLEWKMSQMNIRLRKFFRNVLRGRPTPIFCFGVLFFFFLIFPTSFKISCFLPKSKNFGWKLLKISQNICPKFFCKKWPILFLIFFFRVILQPEKKGKKKKKRPTPLGLQD